MVGDVHGEATKLQRLLRDEGTHRRRRRLDGRRANLCFIGDLVDRGPDGVGALDLIMRLEAGSHRRGWTGPGAARQPRRPPARRAPSGTPAQSIGRGGTFRAVWENAGGLRSDLERLESRPSRLAFPTPGDGPDGRLAARPRRRRLLSPLRSHDGRCQFRGHSRPPGLRRRGMGSPAGRLLRQSGLPWSAGSSRAATFLGVYGGHQIVHGHTPISRFTGAYPEDVPGPLFYAANRCINVDGGMCYGGPGFVARLSLSRRCHANR